MNRVVINVGVGFWYPRGQDRLRESLAAHRAGADLMFWRDCYPPGSPTHQQMPFAFKSHAFRCAREAGYTSILWLDCSAWAVKSLELMWEKIEDDGFLFMNNCWHLGQWASDYCLQVFGLTRDEAMKLGDMTALCFGLNLDHTGAAAFLAEFEEMCKDPLLMNGSLHNKPGERIVDPHSGFDCGVISADPRCRGHAREQVVAGLLMHKYGLLPTSNSPLYLVQGLHPSKTPPAETIIQSCGM